VRLAAFERGGLRAEEGEDVGVGELVDGVAVQGADELAAVAGVEGDDLGHRRRVP
jgi:hypothetical protein